MCPCIFIWLMCFVCEAITIEQHRDIDAKSRIELTPLLISCEINDMAIISSPNVYCKNPLHFLYKPTGEITRLDLNESNTNNYTERVQNVYPKRNYKILDYSLHFRTNSNKGLGEEEKSLQGKDLFLGPFSMEDHGNWLLSVYCKDIDDNWIEMFQTITVKIIEQVPLRIIEIEGGVEISFEYPIRDLESCEIIAPRSTFDRYYDRSKTDSDRCGYTITNLTKEDDGVWTIIGVGKIVYKGTIQLNITE